jgi:ubiquinone/menaquinone biosynthesis C-methylase UbiE
MGRPKPRKPSAPRYLHGYRPEEQARLRAQARFLEDGVFQNIELPARGRLLEVGCGVGAQTEIILRRFPFLHIDGVDAEPAQLEMAGRLLRRPLSSGRVRLHLADAARLPFKPGTFDSAFLCWFLEHVPDPPGVLRELRRVLRPGAVVYCTEVYNSSLQLFPRPAAVFDYWDKYNAFQRRQGGDPDIGPKLASLLLRAGFRKVTVEARPIFRDETDPAARKATLDYWTRLLLSGAPALRSAGIVTPAQVRALEARMTALKHRRDSVFSYTWVQARAEA